MLLTTVFIPCSFALFGYTVLGQVMRPRTISETCFKTYGQNFRCVHARNCGKASKRPVVPTKCGPEAAGVCCMVLSSHSSPRCGIRGSRLTDPNFRVPEQFPVEDLSLPAEDNEYTGDYDLILEPLKGDGYPPPTAPAPQMDAELPPEEEEPAIPDDEEDEAPTPCDEIIVDSCKNQNNKETMDQSEERVYFKAIDAEVLDSAKAEFPQLDPGGKLDLPEVRQQEESLEKGPGEGNGPEVRQQEESPENGPSEGNGPEVRQQEESPENGPGERNGPEVRQQEESLENGPGEGNEPELDPSGGEPRAPTEVTEALMARQAPLPFFGFRSYDRDFYEEQDLQETDDSPNLEPEPKNLNTDTSVKDDIQLRQAAEKGEVIAEMAEKENSNFEEISSYKVSPNIDEQDVFEQKERYETAYFSEANYSTDNVLMTADLLGSSMHDSGLPPVFQNIETIFEVKVTDSAQDSTNVLAHLKQHNKHKEKKGSRRKSKKSSVFTDAHTPAIDHFFNSAEIIQNSEIEVSKIPTILGDSVRNDVAMSRKRQKRDVLQHRTSKDRSRTSRLYSVEIFSNPRQTYQFKAAEKYEKEVIPRNRPVTVSTRTPLSDTSTFEKYGVKSSRYSPLSPSNNNENVLEPQKDMKDKNYKGFNRILADFKSMFPDGSTKKIVSNNLLTVNNFDSKNSKGLGGVLGKLEKAFAKHFENENKTISIYQTMTEAVIGLIIRHHGIKRICEKFPDLAKFLESEIKMNCPKANTFTFKQNKTSSQVNEFGKNHEDSIRNKPSVEASKTNQQEDMSIQEEMDNIYLNLLIRILEKMLDDHEKFDLSFTKEENITTESSKYSEDKETLIATSTDFNKVFSEIVDMINKSGSDPVLSDNYSKLTNMRPGASLKKAPESSSDQKSNSIKEEKLKHYTENWTTRVQFSGNRTSRIYRTMPPSLRQIQNLTKRKKLLSPKPPKIIPNADKREKENLKSHNEIKQPKNNRSKDGDLRLFRQGFIHKIYESQWPSENITLTYSTGPSDGPLQVIEMSDSGTPLQNHKIKRVIKGKKDMKTLKKDSNHALAYEKALNAVAETGKINFKSPIPSNIPNSEKSQTSAEPNHITFRTTNLKSTSENMAPTITGTTLVRRKNNLSTNIENAEETTIIENLPRNSKNEFSHEFSSRNDTLVETFNKDNTVTAVEDSSSPTDIEKTGTSTGEYRSEMTNNVIDLFSQQRSSDNIKLKSDLKEDTTLFTETPYMIHQDTLSVALSTKYKEKLPEIDVATSRKFGIPMPSESQQALSRNYRDNNGEMANSEDETRMEMSSDNIDGSSSLEKNTLPVSATERTLIRVPRQVVQDDTIPQSGGSDVAPPEVLNIQEDLSPTTRETMNIKVIYNKERESYKPSDENPFQYMNFPLKEDAFEKAVHIGYRNYLLSKGRFSVLHLNKNVKIFKPQAIYRSVNGEKGLTGRSDDFPKDGSATNITRDNRPQFIIGGRTEDQPWPWIVAIYRKPSMQFVCAGTLIDNQHVLSAAHCFQRFKSNLVVTIGHLRRTDMSDKKDSVKYHPIKSLFVHSGFTMSCYCNDIALLRLQTELPSTFVPACIPEIDPASNGETATALGWGDTQYVARGMKKQRGSYKLQRVDDLIIYPGNECRNVMMKVSGVNMPKTFGDYYICAGVPDGKKDACIGDSGGPLMFEDYDGTWSLIGVVSFGYKCAEPGVPGTYSRVSYFLPWILKTMNAI